MLFQRIAKKPRPLKSVVRLTKIVPFKSVIQGKEEEICHVGSESQQILKREELLGKIRSLDSRIGGSSISIAVEKRRKPMKAGTPRDTAVKRLLVGLKPGELGMSIVLIIQEPSRVPIHPVNSSWNGSAIFVISACICLLLVPNI